jgi:hypothetical protein
MGMKKMNNSPSLVDRCMMKIGETNMNTGDAYKFCAAKYGPKIEVVRHGRNPNNGTNRERRENVLHIKENAIYKVDKLLEEAKRYDKEYHDGIYISASLDPRGLEKIWALFKKIGFKNLLPIQKAHITIVYSKRSPNKTFQKTPINGTVIPDHFEILGGYNGDPYVLALVVKSKELHRKHKYYMKEYQLKYSFPDYKPHITIVYDIQRILPGIKVHNKKAKQSVENMFNLLIPDMPKQINIHKEEVNALDGNWRAHSIKGSK